MMAKTYTRKVDANLDKAVAVTTLAQDTTTSVHKIILIRTTLGLLRIYPPPFNQTGILRTRPPICQGVGHVCAQCPQ